MHQFRLATLAAMGILFVLLVAMVISLNARLSDLESSGGDNMQWSISQLETEISKLDAVLSQALSDEPPLIDLLELRLDIALSRISIVRSGRAAEIFATSDEAETYLVKVDEFERKAIAVADRSGPLTPNDIRFLRDQIHEIRPAIRELAVIGVKLGAKSSEERRDLFARQLALTGGITVVLMVLMAGLLVALDRLLQKARQRDAALLASSQRLTSTIGASLDAIITSDEKGRVIDYNKSAQAVFGWTREEILGRTMEETIIPPQHRKAHSRGMARYARNRTAHVVDAGRIEMTAMRKTGEEFPIELNVTSSQGPDGIEFIAYLRDIGERKLNEQSLIDARDRAERTDRAKSQFLTIMSHEMRTPLNGILGVLDLLKTTKLGKKQNRYVDIASASGEILLEHVNEALDITRIETGTLALNPLEFDLQELISSVADVLEPLAQEKDLVLSAQIDEGLRRWFLGDSNRIRQIVTNIVGNAIKFTDEGRVSISVSGIHGPRETSVKIAVSDTGPGIEVEDQEQIFEEFVALGSAEGRQSRSDGLGLPISRRIARLMGGDLTVDSSGGTGATFTLTVPLIRIDKAQQTKSDEPPDPAKPSTHQEHRRILIVEDNYINRQILTDMLVGLGHTVVEAVDGSECLKLANETEFDLVFMDISMPNLDGIEATRQLRTGGGINAKVPIVGLTAHGREEYRERAHFAGMDAFHTKPIRLSELQSILRNRASEPIEADESFSSPLDELCLSIGAERLRDTGQKYFHELDDLISAISTGQLEMGSTALKNSAHNAKGGAALFGFRRLGELLQVVAEMDSDADIDDVDRTLAKITSHRDYAFEKINRQVRQFEDLQA